MLGKPRSYSGYRADWQQWKYVFKAYLGALDVKLLYYVDDAECQQAPIPFFGLKPEAQKSTRTLVFIGSQVLHGTVLPVVMNTGDYHGFDAWRLVCRQEEPSSGAAQAALLASVAAARFSGNLPSFVEEAQRLEGQFQVYERMRT